MFRVCFVSAIQFFSGAPSRRKASRPVSAEYADWIFILGMVLGGVYGCVPAERESAGHPIRIEALAEIRHPSLAAWSPDGSQIAFVSDQGGVQNIWTVGVSNPAPAPLTHYESPLIHGDTWIQNGPIDGLFWNKSGTAIYFSREGDLWKIPVGKRADPEPVWRTEQTESGIVLSPDGRQVAFSRGGDLWVRELETGQEKPLTHTGRSESNPVWSPDGRHLAFTSAAIVPSEETLPVAGPKIRFGRMERSETDAGVIAASGGSVQWVGQSPDSESAPSWLDNHRLVVQRLSSDLKTREILVADLQPGRLQTVARDTDDKWWSLTYLNATPLPSPDGRWIAFLSDRDGWDHAYAVSPDGGPVYPITSGRYEVRGLAWAPKGHVLAADANEGENPGARHLLLADLSGDPAHPKLTTLTSGRGTDTGAAWSPDASTILFDRTVPNHPKDLFVIPAQGGERRRLTDSLPASLKGVTFVEPQFVRYPSKDGQPVPAYLFAPKGMDRGQKHPAIVWVHGDGVTQNFDGWPVRRDYAVYYSVHQYFLEQGYVVLAVDYRGSIGYGKAWRQGHYRDLGGKDYEDVAAGVDYLKTLGYVDTGRIGVWGLSYGGFMTLQALTVTPELFACGVDVAGVDDWRDWHHDPDGPWIKGRMGSPEEDPDLYKRTAPIERIDKIVRPLMVLHGTADVNVPFVESVRLIDALVKAGKSVEFMMYPGEFHYFQRANVLTDAWSRVGRFFKSCLHPAAAGRP